MHLIKLSSGRTLAYAEYGDANGAPAFYFHGWPSAGIQGSLMDAAGRELGLRIISPDRPGLGQSDFHPGRRLLDWPPLLVEMAAHLGFDRFHAFGVSGGGPYVLATAFALPDRLLSASIVCGAPPLRVFGTRDLFWPYRVMLVLRRYLTFMMAPVFHVGARVSRQRPGDLPMRLLLGLLNSEDQRVMSDEQILHVVSEGFRQSIRQSVSHVQADADLYLEDWGFDLADIRHPVHMWHGREDKNIPFSYAEKVAARLPNVIPHWTETDGHYSMAAARGREIAQVALGR